MYSYMDLSYAYLHCICAVYIYVNLQIHETCMHMHTCTEMYMMCLYIDTHIYVQIYTYTYILYKYMRVYSRVLVLWRAPASSMPSVNGSYLIDTTAAGVKSRPPWLPVLALSGRQCSLLPVPVLAGYFRFLVLARVMHMQCRIMTSDWRLAHLALLQSL